MCSILFQVMDRCCNLFFFLCFIVTRPNHCCSISVILLWLCHGLSTAGRCLHQINEYAYRELKISTRLTTSVSTIPIVLEGRHSSLTLRRSSLLIDKPRPGHCTLGRPEGLFIPTVLEKEPI